MRQLLKNFLINFIKDDRAFFQFAIPALTAGLGLLKGPPKTSSTLNETSTETGTVSDSGSSVSNPLLSPEAQQLLQRLMSSFGNLQDSPIDINLSTFDKERAAGQNALTGSFAGAREALNADLAGRGLTFSNPAAASLANLRGQEATARGQLDAGIERRKQEQAFQIPFLIENLRQQREQLGQALFRSIPFGTAQTTDSTRNLDITRTTDRQSTGVGPSNRIGNAISGFGAGLALNESLGLPDFGKVLKN